VSSCVFRFTFLKISGQQGLKSPFHQSENLYFSWPASSFASRSLSLFGDVNASSNSEYVLVKFFCAVTDICSRY
jgi:hypothetical protein